MLGVDVSYAQGTIDWHGVVESGKVQFAYAKATEGTDLIDDQFHRNWSTARLVSMPRGGYHFFHFSSDPVAQAKHFLNAVKPAKGDLVPMVDVETDDGVVDIAAKVKSLSAFIMHVENAIGGRRMLIYTSYGFWSDSMGGSDGFSGHPLWIAEYNHDAAPTLPAGWKSWALWQYSDAGSVPGISGNVDLNRVNCEPLALQALTV